MWLEISVTVDDGELAEAVAEVLARYVPDGVSIRATGVVYDPDSEGRGIPPFRVSGYVPRDEAEMATRLQIQTALGHLSLIRPLPEPEFGYVDEENWNESWKQHYHPVRIGKRIIILPEWDREAPEELLPVWIDPGMAFGTGTHPTTQLALELLERSLEDSPGSDVIDIGCGSAILSIAAARLGAGRILGVDIDEDAIDNARLNARINGFEETLVLAVGSVAGVLAGGFPLRSAGLVVANILTHILIRLLDEGLAGLVGSGGRLILSGILAEREPEMLVALEKHGLTVENRRQDGDWIAYLTRR
ncbi:MAG TPA: 50S ribosomal protein L11 methyltransferase [Anaerolineales bacterium]|nr:50S ribosomal protein L11 methyltransferase [Anaerolineales bacterium]